MWAGPKNCDPEERNVILRRLKLCSLEQRRLDLIEMYKITREGDGEDSEKLVPFVKNSGTRQHEFPMSGRSHLGEMWEKFIYAKGGGCPEFAGCVSAGGIELVLFKR